MPSTITINLTDAADVQRGLIVLGEAVVKLAQPKPASRKARASETTLERMDRLVAQHSARVYKPKS